MTSATSGPFRLMQMRPRDPNEPNRAASTLELFFDLVFVIAVSIAAGSLHHSLTEAHFVDGLASYLMIFFAIWWAWMNFTWFATSFDTDDWLYRFLTILQMAGVLVLAAGIEPAFEKKFGILVLGYVVMRVAMVGQWLRASRTAGTSRPAALRYAAGITMLHLLWVGWLFLIPAGSPATIGFLVLVAGELLVPVVAERHGPPPGIRITSPNGTGASR